MTATCTLGEILAAVSTATLCPVETIVSADKSTEAITSRYLFAHHAHEATGNKQAIAIKLTKTKGQVSRMLERYDDMYATDVIFRNVSNKIKNQLCQQ